MSNGRIIGLAASVLIVALVVAASLGYFSQRVGTPFSSISERFTTINGSTFVIINNSTTESVSCVVPVPPPQGIYLRVIADGAGTPVSGLRVTTQSTEAASCDRKNALLTQLHCSHKFKWLDSVPRRISVVLRLHLFRPHLQLHCSFRPSVLECCHYQCAFRQAFNRDMWIGRGKSEFFM